MRSYLRRCESAISSISLSGKRSLSLSSSSKATTPNDHNRTTKPTTSSWYIDECESPICEFPNESNSLNEKSDVVTQRTDRQPSSSNLNQDRTVVIRKSASDCIPKFQQPQAIVLLVSKNRIHYYYYRLPNENICKKLRS